mmetsp:Transcript_11659/g.34571  ORF Transcript_11659/g.34571 Transcript_11659/m.34571 type:complete len:200 (-) Transcript_11659:1613-2212(-)
MVPRREGGEFVHGRSVAVYLHRAVVAVVVAPVAARRAPRGWPARRIERRRVDRDAAPQQRSEGAQGRLLALCAGARVLLVAYEGHDGRAHCEAVLGEVAEGALQHLRPVRNDHSAHRGAHPLTVAPEDLLKVLLGLGAHRRPTQARRVYLGQGHPAVSHALDGQRGRLGSHARRREACRAHRRRRGRGPGAGALAQDAP